MNTENQPLVHIGTLGAPFGIKGWIKLRSYCRPMEQILAYPLWWLRKKDTYQSIRVLEGKLHQKGLIAHLEGIDDIDAAKLLTLTEICIERQQLAPIPDGQYYWHDLIGIKVINQKQEILGVVRDIFEAAGNDVLMVEEILESKDPSPNAPVDFQQKRKKIRHCIPFISKRYIVSVQLETKEMVVDWQKDW